MTGLSWQQEKGKSDIGKGLRMPELRRYFSTAGHWLPLRYFPIALAFRADLSQKLTPSRNRWKTARFNT
jgi:hypothetical protein